MSCVKGSPVAAGKVATSLWFLWSYEWDGFMAFQLSRSSVIVFGQYSIPQSVTVTRRIIDFFCHVAPLTLYSPGISSFGAADFSLFRDAPQLVRLIVGHMCNRLLL